MDVNLYRNQIYQELEEELNSIKDTTSLCLMTLKMKIIPLHRSLVLKSLILLQQLFSLLLSHIQVGLGLMELLFTLTPFIQNILVGKEKADNKVKKYSWNVISYKAMQPDGNSLWPGWFGKRNGT